MNLFDGFSEEQLAVLHKHKAYRQLSGGDIVFREGDAANSLFIILEGTLEVFRQTDYGEFRLGKLGPGDAIGEMGLLIKAGRAASARALMPTVLFEVPTNLVDVVEEAFGPEAAMRLLKNLFGVFAERLAERNERASNPASAVIKEGRFQIEMEFALKVLESHLPQGADCIETRKTLPAKEWLFRAGDAPDGFYFIHQGSLDVIQEKPEKKPRVLKRVDAPAIVGEVGMFSGEPRGASVRAASEVVYSLFSEAQFEELRKKSPKEAMQVMFAAAQLVAAMIIS